MSIIVYAHTLKRLKNCVRTRLRSLLPKDEKSAPNPFYKFYIIYRYSLFGNIDTTSIRLEFF